MNAGGALQHSAAVLNAKRIAAFDEFLEAWHYSTNTRKSYSNFARRFSDFLEGKSFAEVQQSDVSRFRVLLFNQGFSSQSQAAAFYALRKLYKFLQLTNVVSWSPPHCLPRRKVRKRLPRALSEKEIEKLFAAAAVHPRDLALLEFLYATGCRPAETLKMCVEDLQLRAGTVTVREGKDGDRVVCLGRPSLRALNKYLAGRTNGPLFCPEPRKQKGSVLLVGRHRLPWTNGYRLAYWRVFWREWKELSDGTVIRIPRSAFLGRLKELPTKADAHAALRVFLEKRLQDPEQRRLGIFAEIERPKKPLSTRAIGRIVKQIGFRAGLGKGLYPYMLRHSFGTHCLHHGMPLRYVSHLMGHEHAGTTQVYLHSSPDELRSVHRKFFQR